VSSSKRLSSSVESVGVSLRNYASEETVVVQQRNRFRSRHCGREQRNPSHLLSYIIHLQAILEIVSYLLQQSSGRRVPSKVSSISRESHLGRLARRHLFLTHQSTKLLPIVQVVASHQLRHKTAEKKNSKMPVPDSNDNTRPGNTRPLSFKQKKPLAIRKEEVAAIRTKFPCKVPVIVERYYKEQHLPVLDKTKFLVPQEITMSQFITIIRNRLQLNSQQALYLLVSNRNLASLSRPLAQIYRDYRDEDGFLYVTYASQEVFG